MVGPHDEADHTDSDHRVRHAEVAKYGLAAEGRDDLRDHAKARQDHDVDLWVTKEPEQVLVQDRVTAARGVEESRPKVAVSQEHGDRCCKHGKRKQKQEGCDKHRPHKQRHFMEGHTRCTHVEDGGDEVGRAKDRARTRQVKREDRKVDRWPRSTSGG